MLTKAKVLAHFKGIYRVEMEDDRLGLKEIMFILPFFDQESFTRIIAGAYFDWVAQGNGNPEALPEIDMNILSEVLNAAENKIVVLGSDAPGTGPGLAGGGNQFDPMGLGEEVVTDDDADAGGPDDQGVWNDNGELRPWPVPDPGGVVEPAGPEAGEGQPSPGPGGEGAEYKHGDPVNEGIKTSRS